jgi:hypothetical protein
MLKYVTHTKQQQTNKTIHTVNATINNIAYSPNNLKYVHVHTLLEFTTGMKQGNIAFFKRPVFLPVL